MLPNLFVGIDLASGPDVSVLWTRNRNGEINIMARTAQDHYTSPTLEGEALNAIVERMYAHDSVISKQIALRESAMAEIIAATAKIDEAYKARQELSAQLDKFAPDDFMQPKQDTASEGMHLMAAMPAPWGQSPKPWHMKDPALKVLRPAPATRDFADFAVDGEL